MVKYALGCSNLFTDWLVEANDYAMFLLVCVEEMCVLETYQRSNQVGYLQFLWRDSLKFNNKY